jgi:hypothetical protein
MMLCTHVAKSILCVKNSLVNPLSASNVKKVKEAIRYKESHIQTALECKWMEISTKFLGRAY